NISEGYSTASDDEDITNQVHESGMEESLDEESVDELEKQLEEALENEDYELASKIRDEINKRKK
ncbi:MAG: UvrB/UvrC motif-containing protein, partial [Crocinitomicaceae bacterium]